MYLEVSHKQSYPWVQDQCTWKYLTNRASHGYRINVHGSTSQTELAMGTGSMYLEASHKQR
ncbi:hypothetical protein DPMN_063571 [Dreissena polymorpha]|uniref:Uncharacterized protein n=1 Tax=Dreissena polymorpha TaxID=45954 RepID=A0A9D4CAS4_DREPO|nr:hypothetical protein DPMN_063571 [Dreissena polymorpha]